ncbi:MAG: PrsW family intramembrane metalloprotease [Lachnospiraceae bacterium]|nr:PrsW family intramembrane metalloprotease [Lachnospiraceae bacterium]
MERIGYIVFICFALPFMLGIPIVRGRARLVIIFIFVGMCCCLFISEINGLINNAVGKGIYYVTTNITPLTEEVIKALPVLLYAVFISSERQSLLTIAFMTGLGFALLENSTILVQTVILQGSVDFLWALIRTLGAGLLHSLCTTSVGVGISFIRDHRKFFLCGSFALLFQAIVYHSVYNSLIQSKYKYFGAAMPMVTYLIIIVILVIIYVQNGKKQELFQ